MSNKMCTTCIYLTDGADCPIYKVARETQIAHVAPWQFGCAWHRTAEEYEAMIKAREEVGTRAEETP